MPLSKKRNAERMRLTRLHVQPKPAKFIKTVEENPIIPVQPECNPKRSVRATSVQPGRRETLAKLAKAGLTIKDGTLDLTQSTREPVRPESNTTVPMFNPSIHKAGDKVMVYQGKKLIETVIPELDADGQPVYE